jgi:hypothetical protein
VPAHDEEKDDYLEGSESKDSITLAVNLKK